MMIKYNSLKSHRHACIGGIIFFSSGALVELYIAQNQILFWLNIIMVFAGILATFITYYKNPFSVIDVKIDTDSKMIYLNIASDKNDIIGKNIPFDQVLRCEVELATRTVGSDYIQFTTSSDLSFAMPIQYFQIKELENFFDIKYHMIGNIKTNESKQTKIKKLYKSGLLGSLFSVRGYLFTLLVLILFLFNIAIIIP